MPDQFAMFVSLAGTVIGLVFITLYQVPAIAKVGFQNQLSALKDSAEDLLLDGEIEHGACIDAFIRRCDLAAMHAGSYSILRAAIAAKYLARHGVFAEEQGQRLYPSVAALSPNERRIIHDLDARFQASMRRYLLTSSPSGWLLATLIKLSSFVLRRSETKTQELVQGYGEAAVSMSKELRTQRRLSPVLVGHGAPFRRP
ncbi:MAG TPA: hypothetical protein VF557_19605 [Jatrophihabitans sp.]|uniref:hypothetical protein n=1 Tax=Jatrophihabitans sp. TaxID=1932789 RepID=UPI002F230DFB